MERFSPADFRAPPIPVARIRVPTPLDTRDGAARRTVAQRLRAVTVDDTSPPRDGGGAGADQTKEEKALRKSLERHPVHGCPELHRHLHFAQRAERLEKEIASIDRRVGRRTGTLARRFVQVLEVLETLDYVAGWALTDKGETLTRVYNESDLLVVEAVERRLLAGLDAAELAALCSTLVYEARGPEMEVPADMPTRAAAKVWGDLMRLWRTVRREEDRRGLELTREPDPGYAHRTYLWASGLPLEQVLDEGDAPGDFVRNMKQLIDLLRQLEEVATTEELRATVQASLAQVKRGVVAYSSVDL